MAFEPRRALAVLLVVVVGTISRAIANNVLVTEEDDCVTLDYTLSPEGVSALQLDTELRREAGTYASHSSSTSPEILISLSAKGFTNEAIIAKGLTNEAANIVNIGQETSEDGTTTATISIPNMVQLQEDTINSEEAGEDARGPSAAYKDHKRGDGAGVLAACPALTSVSVSIPDTHCMRLLPSAGTILLKDCSSSSAALTGGLPVMDTHTHAWEHCYRFCDEYQDLSACTPTPGAKARYIPAGVLPFPQLEEKWFRQNVTYGVLVQPSFLGANNSYISSQLAMYPRLRGVIVVTNADGTLDADAAERALLEEHHEAGVRGIRLNLLKHSEEDMARVNAAMDAETGEEGFKDLWAFIKEHGWHVEAQKESAGWVDLIDTLVGTGCRVVVDHFSRPSPALNLEDPGWKAVLAAAKGNDNIFMKITGTYRLGVGPDILAEMARLAKENFGIDRLLWGSDYPHTGCAGPDVRHCEDSQDYEALLHTVVDWFPDVEDRQKVLFLNGAKVFSLP